MNVASSLLSLILKQNSYLRGRMHGNSMKTFASSVLASGSDLGEAIRRRLTPLEMVRLQTGERFGWTGTTT